MKLTNYGILFIIILIPFFLYNHYDSRRNIVNSFQERAFDNVVEKALDDATTSMFTDTVIDDQGRIQLNKEIAIESFFKTLAINFGYQDVLEIEYLKSYVPLIIIIDYDGVQTYSAEKYIETTGETVIKHILHEKIYLNTSAGNDIITMYLDGYYKVLSNSRNRSFYGTYAELQALSLNTFFDQPESDIINLRKNLLNNIITNELLRINKHNEFAAINGVSYDFFIPVIEDDLNTSTIENVGLIATVQGFPLNSGKEYNNLAIGINSITEKQKIYGYDDGGKLVYHEEGCTHMTGTLVEIFTSKSEAAKSGYYPDYDCN